MTRRHFICLTAFWWSSPVNAPMLPPTWSGYWSNLPIMPNQQTRLDMIPQQKMRFDSECLDATKELCWSSLLLRVGVRKKTLKLNHVFSSLPQNCTKGCYFLPKTKLYLKSIFHEWSLHGCCKEQPKQKSFFVKIISFTTIIKWYRL